MYSSDSDSSEAESGGIQKKALDVSLPENFDPDSIPQTGEEYLQHVIYERTKKCKKWVTAKEDFTKFNKNQTVHINTEIDLGKPLDKFYPTKEWQENALNDFIQLRNYVSNSEKPVPARERFKSEDFIMEIEKNPPRFSDITQYSQAAKIQMLQDITTLLRANNNNAINKNIGAWIYAVLALLEKPLSPDCCYKLREFSKVCIGIRSKFTESVESDVALPYNLFICIISKYFNQLDLF